MKKYYKYITKPFIQPSLTKDGKLGEGYFSCVASAIYATGYEAYRVFSKSFANNALEGWHSPGSVPQWLAWYCKNPLSISTIKITNGNNASYPDAIKDYQIQTSEDGTEWSTIFTGTNTDNTPNLTWEIDLSEVSLEERTSKYFRIYVTSQHNRNYVRIKQINITAIENVPKLSTEDDYDFFLEIPDGIGKYFVLNKPYKYKEDLESENFIEFTEAGTYTFTLDESVVCDVILVGAGSNYKDPKDRQWTNEPVWYGGGSGSLFQGNFCLLEPGTYKVEVPAGGSTAACTLTKISRLNQVICNAPSASGTSGGAASTTNNFARNVFKDIVSNFIIRAGNNGRSVNLRNKIYGTYWIEKAGSVYKDYGNSNRQNVSFWDISSDMERYYVKINITEAAKGGYFYLKYKSLSKSKRKVDIKTSINCFFKNQKYCVIKGD